MSSAVDKGQSKTVEDVESKATEGRQVKHPTTKFETLVNFMVAIAGTGVYSMPLAFSHIGLLTGLFTTVFTALISTHCFCVLVRCSNKLCQKTNRTSMTFPEVIEAACLHGPVWSQSWAKSARRVTTGAIFLTYFGTCSVFIVIVAENVEQIVRYHFENYSDIRIYIALIWIPCLLLCWVPHLKYLAPFSVIASILILIGFLITLFYCLTDMPTLSERPLHTSYTEIPPFFGIAIFAMAGIGVILPLENKMKHPEQMAGACGVLSLGMTLITFLYGVMGFIGFTKYGDKIRGSITLNLPVNEIPAQIVKISITVSVFFITGLEFYVLLEIVWKELEAKITKWKTLKNYILRTALVTAFFLLSIAVPTIGPFVGLLGAFFFSILGLLVPVFIETMTYWDQGFGKYNWMLWKNVAIYAFGMTALIFGTRDALSKIVKLYTDKQIYLVMFNENYP